MGAKLRPPPRIGRHRDCAARAMKGSRYDSKVSRLDLNGVDPRGCEQGLLKKDLIV